MITNKQKKEVAKEKEGVHGEENRKKKQTLLTKNDRKMEADLSHCPV